MAGIEVDNQKLMYHPKRVAQWEKEGDCYPLYIEIGVTNDCNHRCVFCALDFLKKGKDYINTDIMRNALEDMAVQGVKSVMFAGEGEPLCHENIGTFVQQAKKSGMDVSITTNGAEFSHEKIEQCLPHLSWIRFSVDSGSPENYAKIHRTKKEDFYKVIGNIKDAVKFRNVIGLGTTIGVQFLMIPQNMNQAPELAKILIDIGADNLQVKPYSHHPNSLNNFVVDAGEYNKLESELKGYSSENFQVLFRRATIERIEEGITYPKCYGLPFFALTDAKGNVLPCNMFYGEEEFTYGNLYKNNFKEIWDGERRKEVLKRIEEKGIADCRRGCRLDSANRYLHRIKNPHPHDNFI